MSTTRPSSRKHIPYSFNAFETPKQNFLEKLLERIINFVNSIFPCLSENKPQKSASINKERVSINRTPEKSKKTNTVAAKNLPKNLSNSSTKKNLPATEPVLDGQQSSQIPSQKLPALSTEKKPQLNKTDINANLSPEDTAIYENILKIVSRINNTENKKAISSLDRALTAQIRGLSQLDLQKIAIEISAKNIKSA
ncbi:MAG: hypothetical protein K1060chlam3_00133 [Candidatus Anoxychlamydiales bacterium]|nr:hypothetical protein [Candidatus Anoxychlamydiales bacterium]